MRSNSCHDILRLCANTESPTPDAKARGNVVLRLSTPMAAPRTFEYQVRNPRNGPYLSTMCVAAQLEVDARLLCFGKVVWLMVEEDGVGGGLRIEDSFPASL